MRHGAVHGPDQGFVLGAMRGLDAGSDARRVHGFIGELCHWLDHRRFETGSPVERAVGALEDEPFSDRGVAETAAMHGVSREHLNLVFRRRHGRPPGVWLLERRRARARELLADTPLRMSEVAERCGMGSARRLSRALRRDDQRRSHSG